MGKHVALLRGINVGGHAIVSMARLRAAFVAAGCGEVATYIQSGNVVFTAPSADLGALGHRLEPALRALVGAEAVVLFRSHRDLAEAVKRAPIRSLADAPGAKLYLSFLARRATRRPEVPLVSIAKALEVSPLGEVDLFVVSRRKNGRYGFPNGFVERQLGVPATTRNWATVTKLLELSA